MQNYSNRTDARMHACASFWDNESAPDASRFLKFNPPVRPIDFTRAIEFNRPIEFDRALGFKIDDALGKFSVRSSIFNPADRVEYNGPIELYRPHGWIELQISGCIETALISLNTCASMFSSICCIVVVLVVLHTY